MTFTVDIATIALVITLLIHAGSSVWWASRVTAEMKSLRSADDNLSRRMAIHDRFEEQGNAERAAIRERLASVEVAMDDVRDGVHELLGRRSAEGGMRRRGRRSNARGGNAGH